MADHIIIVDISIEQIRMARGLLNISRADVAKAAQISPASYGEIEAGNSDPKLSNFKNIVFFFQGRGIIFHPNGHVNLNSKNKSAS